jgi:hypothetical protein
LLLVLVVVLWAGASSSRLLLCCGDRDRLQVDEVALYSVSPAWMAKRITDIILEFADASSVVRCCLLLLAAHESR